MVEIKIEHSKHYLMVAGPIAGRGVVLGYKPAPGVASEKQFSAAEARGIEKLAALASELGGLSLTDLQGIAAALKTAYDSENYG